MPLKKIIYLFTFLLFFPLGVFAQGNTNDSIQVAQAINKAFALHRSQPDSALQIAEQALILAEAAKDTQNLINLWRIKG